MGFLLGIILSQSSFDTQEFVEAFVRRASSLTHTKILMPLQKLVYKN